MKSYETAILFCGSRLFNSLSRSCFINLFYSSLLSRSSCVLCINCCAAKGQHSQHRKGCKNFFHEIKNLLVSILMNLCFHSDGDFSVIPTSCSWHLVQAFHLIRSLKQAWTRSCYESLAERRGFEPRKPFWSLHAFQACLFNHSSISPLHPNARKYQ